jgi:hypothetical protein
MVLPFGEPGMPIQGLPAYRVYRADGGFIPAPADIDNLKHRSALSMLPGIKAELSSLNSLIELKDFRSLFSTISNIYTFISKFNLRDIGRTLRSMTQTSGDGYLQAQFNVLPLLSDIAGIQQAILRTKLKVDELLRRAQVVNTRHYQVSLSEHDSGSDASDAYLIFQPATEMSTAFDQYVAGYLSRQTYSDPSVFHAEIEYNFTLSRYEVENAQLLGLLDALGINANPAILWNAIPWSFVVDWVLGVSRWLSSHGTTLNLEPRVNIRRYLWSVKRRRLINTQFNTVNLVPGSGALPVSVPLPVVEETAYRRRIDSLHSSSFEASGISLRELSLGAALIIPRKWRPRRRW